MEGRVIKSTGSWYIVQDTEGNTFSCRLRGKFKLKAFKATNPIAVGDLVEFSIEDGAEGTGIISKILKRENYIIRKAAHKTGQSHIIASNIDQAILIATLLYPKTSLGFIDRFLVSAEAFRIPAIIAFNKSDIYNEEALAIYEELAALYNEVGYQTFLMSATEEQGLEEIKQLLKDRTTLLTGHSGVGKSTLINKLIPTASQKVAAISDFAQKGTHTTTFAEIFAVNPTTFIIDTPGIKEWGLVDIEDQELSHFFPELRALLGQCRFYNCTHTHEPGCAIIEAFNKGTVAESRYQSYLSMLDNVDNRR